MKESIAASKRFGRLNLVAQVLRQGLQVLLPVQLSLLLVASSEFVLGVF